ncbi:MAG: hypothetical protein RI973_849 [Bacteroidota bacterium]|jgi:hypothetical protein
MQLVSPVLSSSQIGSPTGHRPVGLSLRSCAKGPCGWFFGAARPPVKASGTAPRPFQREALRSGAYEQARMGHCILFTRGHFIAESFETDSRDFLQWCKD